MTHKEAFLKSNWIRQAFRVLVFTLGFVTLAANLYVRFYYAAAMPRSPQPQVGRIYAVPAQYGGTVYINRREYDARTFVRDDLISIFGVLMLVYVGTEVIYARRLTRTKTVDGTLP